MRNLVAVHAPQLKRAQSRQRLSCRQPRCSLGLLTAPGARHAIEGAGRHLTACVRSFRLVAMMTCHGLMCGKLLLKGGFSRRVQPCGPSTRLASSGARSNCQEESLRMQLQRRDSVALGQQWSPFSGGIGWRWCKPPTAAALMMSPASSLTAGRLAMSC